MSRIRLAVGNILYKGTRKLEVLKHIDLKTALMKDLETGKREVLSISQLKTQAQVSEGGSSENSFHQGTASDEHWAVAKRRYEIVKPLLNRRKSRQEIVERAQEFSVHFTTIYQWIKRYEAVGKLSALLPGFDKRGGKGESRLAEEAEAIVNDVLDRVFQKAGRTNLEKIMKEIEKKCKAGKIKPPHISTVRRRIHCRPRGKVKKILKGEDPKRQLKGKHEVIFPLEEIQVDETPLDIILVDEKHRLPIGRAFGTFATDVMSRVVYGFSIHLEHPSFFTFGQCMCMGILRKEPFLRQVGVKGEWLVWGLAKGVTIHTDNAVWYRGTDLKRFSDEYGVSVTFRAAGKPETGGHIERLIKTLNKKIHGLPGTTFMNVEEKGNYPSEKLAVMTVKELEKWLTEAIVNGYHHQKHSSLNDMTPMQRWEQGVLGTDEAPGCGLPDVIQGEEAELLRLSLLPTIERTIQRGMVTIDKIPYFHEVLHAVEEKDAQGRNKQYPFKRDPRDISTLYFIDKENKLFYKIPYSNPGWPSLSAWEFREVKRRMRKLNISDQDPEKVFETYERMREIQEQATLKTKAARRAEEMRKNQKEKMKTTDSEKTEIAKDGRDERLRSIFQNAKPVRDIRIIGSSKADNEEESA